MEIFAYKKTKKKYFKNNLKVSIKIWIRFIALNIYLKT